MPKKFRPGTTPDQGGYVHHDQYYKPPKERGKPQEPALEGRKVKSKEEIEKIVDSDMVYSSLLRWLKNLDEKTTGTNIHEISNLKNVFTIVRDLLKGQSFLADATFEELKKGKDDDVELYDMIVKTLQKAQKILPGFTI